MRAAFYHHISAQLDQIKSEGLYKAERIITSPQSSTVTVAETDVLNLCANNYLGLANAPELIEAGQNALARYGYGMASVRFICGTQDIHKKLERRLSAFLGFEDTILYSSCFDANTGLFETILTDQDAVISDNLNHASIIDGIRLCKAKRFRYANNDMADLEQQLRRVDEAGCRYKLIATDGVFSMDGRMANLTEICDLADRYNALVMVDDSHAVGCIGANGRGTHEYCDVMGRVDILTGTLGKAMGGASGGYVAGKRELVDWLRNRSRPYLFSNTLSPTIVASTLCVLDMLEEGDNLRHALMTNARQFRCRMQELGFTLAGRDHPIIPVMLGDAALAQQFAERMLAEGVYVIGFSFPVVPKGEARIRVQISAAHSQQELDLAIAAFAKVGRELGVITATERG